MTETRVYELITSDPDWDQEDLASLCRKVPPTAENAVLCIWARRAHLFNALRVIEAWGFTYQEAAFTWLKVQPSIIGRFVENILDERLWSKGNGHTTTGGEEFCLLAIKGKGLLRASTTVRSTLIAPQGRDSKKPDEFYRRLERLYPQNMYPARLEMFGKLRRSGWDAYGQGIVGSIDLPQAPETYPQSSPYHQYLWRKLQYLNGRGGHAVSTLRFSLEIGLSERQTRYYLTELHRLKMVVHPCHTSGKRKGQEKTNGGWIAVVNPPLPAADTPSRDRLNASQGAARLQ